MATRITVDDLLDELEELVDKATRLPLSRGRAVLDSNDVLDIIADIRDNLPQESRQARAIVADRNQILSDARRRRKPLFGWRRKSPRPWSIKMRLLSVPSKKPTIC